MENGQEPYANILVIDDEMGVREGCRRALTPRNMRVSTAESGAEGLRKLREESFDLVLLDAMMPGLSGLEFLDYAREHDPELVCVMITGYATVDLAAPTSITATAGIRIIIMGRTAHTTTVVILGTVTGTRIILTVVDTLRATDTTIRFQEDTGSRTGSIITTTGAAVRSAIEAVTVGPFGSDFDGIQA